MPVPTSITDLTNSPATNSPAGTESVKGTIDDYLRAHAAFIRQNYDQTQGPSVTLASAASVNVGFAGSANILITGTTNIFTFDDVPEGALRWVIFAGVLTISHTAPVMQLPGSVNITTTPGDVGLFKSLGGGNWRCIAYMRISGTTAHSANTARDGYLTAADWTAFNSKQAALGFTPYNATNPAGFITASAAASAFVDATGDTMSGQLVIDTSGSGGQGLSINNTAGVPQMRFVGATGVKYMRLNASTLEWVDQAYGSVIMSLNDSGVLSAPVVTQTSDERKKRGWQHLPKDFVAQLAGIKKSGLFTWRKGGAAGLGVGAQSLERILPLAVHTDERGAKTVNYGAAALVSSVELARAVVVLEARLAAAGIK